jgi:hypothetical protein
MDYKVFIANNVAQISLEQQFINPMDALLELEYMFPI